MRKTRRVRSVAHHVNQRRRRVDKDRLTRRGTAGDELGSRDQAVGLLLTRHDARDGRQRNQRGARRELERAAAYSSVLHRRRPMMSRSSRLFSRRSWTSGSVVVPSGRPASTAQRRGLGDARPPGGGTGSVLRGQRAGHAVPGVASCGDRWGHAHLAYSGGKRRPRLRYGAGAGVPSAAATSSGQNGSRWARGLAAPEGENVYLQPHAAYQIAQKVARASQELFATSAQTLRKRLYERGMLPPLSRMAVKRTC